MVRGETMAARSGNGADSGRLTPRRSRALLQAVALAAFAAGLCCLTGTATAEAAEAAPPDHGVHLTRPAAATLTAEAVRSLARAARERPADPLLSALGSLVQVGAVPPAVPGDPSVAPLRRPVLHRASRAAVRTPTGGQRTRGRAGDGSRLAPGQQLPPVRPLTGPGTACAGVSRGPHPDGPAAGTRGTARVAAANPATLDREDKSVGICAVADSGPPSLPLFQPPSATGTARATPRLRASEPAVYPD